MYTVDIEVNRSLCSIKVIWSILTRNHVELDTIFERNHALPGITISIWTVFDIYTHIGFYESYVVIVI